MPSQTNALGTVFGGQIMAWIDVCAAVAAQRLARSDVVTVGMDQLSFKQAIRQGQIVVLQAMVNWAGASSMEVGVRVEREDPSTGVRSHTSTAYLTFVAVDEHGRPKKVPALMPSTGDQLRRFAEARARRELRLAERRSE